VTGCGHMVALCRSTGTRVEAHQAGRSLGFWICPGSEVSRKAQTQCALSGSAD
jgi:hypothetical protein